jgi:hypothetical protein
MADRPSPALKDRLLAALRELADTLTTAKRVALEVERGLGQPEPEISGSRRPGWVGNARLPHAS